MSIKLEPYTDLLILRPVKSSDFEKIFEWENDPVNWIQSGTTEPYSRSDIELYVSRPQDLFKDGQTRYMIDLKDGQTIGCVDLFDYDAKKSISSLGIIIEKPFRSKGYAFEVLNIIILNARKQLKIKILKALVLKYNKSSVALFSKAGFKSNNQITTHYFYKNIEYTQLTYLKNIE